MSDIRGKSPSGRPQPVTVDRSGRVLIRSQRGQVINEAAQITSTSGSSSFLTVPVGAFECDILVLVNPIYFTLDGSLPSSTNGWPAAVGAIVTLESPQECAQFQAVRQAGNFTLAPRFYSERLQQ